MIYSAFLIGLLGSIHCIGMCGPLQSALPYGRFNTYKSILARGLFQFGRISAYTGLGLFLGALGMTISIFSGQQILSILIGSALILYVIVPHQKAFNNPFLSKFNNYVKNNIGKLIRRDNYFFFWLTGFLNGLLPCGLVWLAIASALAYGNLIESSLFMLIFGLGTIPALIGFHRLYSLIKTKVSFNYYSNYLAVIFGMLLIARGLNLGGPLSPEKAINNGIDKVITICGFN